MCFSLPLPYILLILPLFVVSDLALNQPLCVTDYEALCAFQLAIFHLLSWMACFVTPSSSSISPTTPLDISWGKIE